MKTKISIPESVPAKAWELLRRNKEFENCLEHLLKLHQTDVEYTRNYIDEVAGLNPFASLALEWSLPPHQALPPENGGIVYGILSSFGGPCLDKNDFDLWGDHSAKGEFPVRTSISWDGLPELFKRRFSLVWGDFSTDYPSEIFAIDYPEEWKLEEDHVHIVHPSEFEVDSMQQWMIHNFLIRNLLKTHFLLAIPRNPIEGGRSWKDFDKVLKPYLDHYRIIYGKNYKPLGSDKEWEYFLRVENKLSTGLFSDVSHAVEAVRREVHPQVHQFGGYRQKIETAYEALKSRIDWFFKAGQGISFMDIKRQKQPKQTKPGS